MRCMIRSIRRSVGLRVKVRGESGRCGRSRTGPTMCRSLKSADARSLPACRRRRPIPSLLRPLSLVLSNMKLLSGLGRCLTRVAEPSPRQCLLVGYACGSSLHLRGVGSAHSSRARPFGRVRVTVRTCRLLHDRAAPSVLLSPGLQLATPTFRASARLTRYIYRETPRDAL